MDTPTHSMLTDLDNPDNSFIAIHPGDKVRVIYLNKLRTCTVLRHSDGKVYCKWKEVVVVRQFSQVLTK